MPLSVAQLEARRAAARLITVEREKLMQFAERRLGGATQASRFVAEVLMRRLREPDKLRRGESLPEWLDRKVTRALLDWGEQELGAESEALTKSQHLWNQATTRCLLELLEVVEPRYRDVLRRVDFGAESKAAVARHLRLSSSTMDVLLHRARQAVRRGMEKVCAPHDAS